MKKIKVEIIKPFHSFKEGKVLELPTRTATELIAGGYAKEYKEAKPKPAPKKRATKKDAE